MLPCRCGASGMAVVLDTASCNIFVSTHHSDILREYIMPGADALLEKLQEGILGSSFLRRVRSGSAKTSKKTAFLVTSACRAEAKVVKEKVMTHISSLLNSAEMWRKENEVPISSRLQTRDSKDEEDNRLPPMDGCFSRKPSSRLSHDEPNSSQDGGISSDSLRSPRRQSLASIALSDSSLSTLEDFPDCNENKFYERFTSTQVVHL